MYPLSLREEELKNKVAADVFGDYDCTRILGNIDFCVEPSLYWAEAKNRPTDIHRMLAQLILTIKGEGKARHLDAPPRFVGCFDPEKIAFVEYHNVLPVFNLNDFNWTQTPSAVDEKTVETVRRAIPDGEIALFRFGVDDRELKSFIHRGLALGESPSLATRIDKNNFIFIYQKWRAEVMPHIDAPWDVLKKKYSLYDRDFFLAELNVDDNGTAEIADDRPASDFYIAFDAHSPAPYTIRRKNEDELNFNLTFGFKDGLAAYAAFWRRYKRPPTRENWDFIVSRLDLLVPQDVRERKGAFFTPAVWVEKSQECLAEVLGPDWQDEYDVWDCAGGIGNLVVGLTNKYRVWVSTLDQQDVDVMRQRIANGANLLDSHVFQFDFLNDSFNKLPQGLRDIINDPERRKKLVIYINPPYAEAGDTKQWTGTGKNKTDVAVTTATYAKYLTQIGLAGRELFAQFLIRIDKELPGCVIAQFSKPKHLQAPNFEVFRQSFQPKLKSAFLVRGNTFDNVKGKFPIGFFVWDTSQREAFSETDATVLANDGSIEGTKHILCYDNMRGNIGKWLSSFADNDSKPIGFMSNGRNDFQNQKLVYIINRKEQMPTPRGWHITPHNIIPMCIFLAVRHCIEADWLNDRDQFLWPADTWRTDYEFQLDCLVFTLFHGQNRISCKAGLNHWIPFPESEVDAKDAYKSHFMVDFLKGVSGRDASTMRPQNRDGRFVETSLPDDLFVAKDSFNPSTFQPFNLSTCATRVLDAGRALWRYYHSQPNALPDASFYDIRAHFQGFKPNGHMNPDSPDAEYTRLIGDLRAAMKALAAQIAPQVRAHGFLK